jgi:DNA-binding response OmpR family regulator
MKVVFLSRDEETIENFTLALRLRWPDLQPLIAHSGDLGVDVIEEEEPDLVLVSNDMPDMSLNTAIQEIRRFSDIPLIAVTKRECNTDPMSLVKALDLGADDFIIMPSNLMEVMARVVALIRRAGLSRDRVESGPIHCGDLVVIPDTFEAYMGSDLVQLTPTEFKLLLCLVKNRGVILTREAIKKVVGLNDFYSSDTLKKYVQRLRQKLGDDSKNPKWIKTVYGIGYRFN